MRLTLLIAAVSAAALAGCSSPPPPPPLQPGDVANGTAQVSIDDASAVTTDTVACTEIGPLTTITTGDDASGVTAVVSNADQLTAASVSIRELGGFTGSYNAGLGGESTVTLTGRTYAITGSADGFATDSPSFRTSGTFAIKVAC